MTASPRVSNPTSGRVLPLLIVLFVGSGCAALIYEIVWFQMLQLVIGSTGISLGVLLGSFMGGMFLGSLALPKFVSIDRHPLRVYAVLELAIGALGLILLALIPLVSGVYTQIVPQGTPSILFRALLAGLLLLPPTILMGATLPAISRYVKATPTGVSWMGFFYGGNIAGAVAGCLLAGFYLLREYDTGVSTFVAIAINVTVTVLALALARFAAYDRSRSEQVEAPPGLRGARHHRAILLAIGLSGLTALGAEVIWTRLLALALGATTYTFSILLAVFLGALGVGSILGSYISRHTTNARMTFAICQAGTVLGIAWTSYCIMKQLPYWPINPALAIDPAYLFQIDLVRAVWALAPAPFFWGASFPLAVAAAAEKDQDSGALIGRIYAANTIGAIIGSLSFGVLMIVWLGTVNAQRLLIFLATLSGIILIWPAFIKSKAHRTKYILAALGAICVISLSANISGIPSRLLTYGRHSAVFAPSRVIYVGEGRNSYIAVSERDDGSGSRTFHIGGKGVASTEPRDMRVQGMLGHLTALLHDEPKTVLVVGFGAGVTAGTFITHPSVERIVICEIEPLIVTESSHYFKHVNNDVLSDPRVEVVFDDARHFLLTTDETFDIITSDPIHPWFKGAAALYTEEYFHLVKKHLNPGGVVTQWVPLYESTLPAVKSELVTFFKAFPDGAVWGNEWGRGGYDVVLAAKNGGIHVDIDKFVNRMKSPDHSQVAVSLTKVGFPRTMDLLAHYTADANDLVDWLKDAQMNNDNNLRLQYLAGLGLNAWIPDAIFAEILAYRRYPDDKFSGSPFQVSVLKDMMGYEVTPPTSPQN